MVEVFKTNVQEPAQAAALLSVLMRRMSLVRVTFDLEDCDRVLRVEGVEVCAHSIIEQLTTRGFHCQVLE